jgi:vesicle coat complex subunit
MEVLSQMEIKDPKIAEIIVDRCLSRLSHINPSVILSAIKVILKFTLVINNE